jgi:dissimilatory sulfite reductase (desulfoviridin) alpha/beta subunit
MPLDEIKNLSDVFSRYKKAEIQICDVRNLNIFQLTPTEIDNLVSLT